MSLYITDFDAVEILRVGQFDMNNNHFSCGFDTNEKQFIYYIEDNQLI